VGGVLIDWNPRYLYNRLLKNDQEKINFFLTSICTQTWNEEQDKGRSKEKFPLAVKKFDF
jgi:2-haloacid dehalogenase